VSLQLQLILKRPVPSLHLAYLMSNSWFHNVRVECKHVEGEPTLMYQKIFILLRFFPIFILLRFSLLSILLRCSLLSALLQFYFFTFSLLSIISRSSLLSLSLRFSISHIIWKSLKLMVIKLQFSLFCSRQGLKLVNFKTKKAWYEKKI